MKRNIARIAVLATAAAAVLMVTSRLVGASQEAPIITTRSDDAGYVVREHNGKVALFTGEFAVTPAVETDIDVAGLRAYDRQLLSDGIEVENYEDVLKLIEDLGS